MITMIIIMDYDDHENSDDDHYCHTVMHSFNQTTHDPTIFDHIHGDDDDDHHHHHHVEDDQHHWH